ncbi:TIGR04255 family protein [Egbenema bharatensis]|uniref:TIGR04255 family protein n=1 Tax=Egbenema bharatensis TaxID=3463334 RepID=UPI003A8BBBAC
MQARRHYSRAPITEAVIDLRVNLPQGATLAALADVHMSIAADYPNQESLLVIQGEMSAGESIGATASQTQIGFGYASSDRKQIVQVRLDGFAFSRLAPYEHWEQFRDEAKRLWEIYQTAIHPTSITRLAVRYINRLDLPLPMKDFKDYLRVFPEVPPDLSESLNGYFMQLQIPSPEVEATLLLNQAIIPTSDDSVVSVLLDIDLFKLCDVSVEEMSFWNILERLHEKTDQIFEACITDETRELIK